MYPEYKATRNKTPEDLHAQIPWVCDILQALGVPVLQCDGYEADDIIATVAKKCQEQGRTCRILSGDKDLMQLVTESTQILKPESGASTWKVTGIDGVKMEWGVEPAQLLDLLALYGDTADNIPGVTGVGVKTAAKHHEERYRKLLKNVEDKLVFSKDGDAIWQCRNCGHIVVGKEAPAVCPVCAHPQAYFEVSKENY